MTQAAVGDSAPARPVQITSAELDAYNARQRELGREAVRLGAKKDAACKAIYDSTDFVGHRFATAFHTIAVERCDAAFNMRVWGRDPGQADRRAALGKHLRTIRNQIAEARARRAAEAVELAKAA